MIIVNSLNESRFTLNGVQYFKNYISKIAGNNIIIFNCYDNKDVLLPWTSYEQVYINGSAYESAETLQEAILDVIYLRTTLGNSESFVQNNVGVELLIGELSGEGNISTSEAETAINSLSWSIVVSRVRTPVIISFTRSQKKYMFIFLKGYGIWGSANGSNPDDPISANDLIALPALNLTNDDIQNQNGTVIINLGNLPTGNYLTAANSEPRDFSDAGTLDDDGYPITYYFSYTQDGVLYFVQFVGTAGIYNGNLQASDLISSTNSTVIPNIEIDETVTESGVNPVQGSGIYAFLTGLNDIILVTTSVNISTQSAWNSRIIHIDNGANNINLGVNDVINTAFTKLGTGTITVTEGTKTLVLADNIDECNGVKGSTFLLTPDETTADQLILLMSNR